MSLNNVTTVRGYAIYLGLDPIDRSVLRRIQRQCERGDLNAKLDHGTWLIEIPKNTEGEIIMKNWESMKDIQFEGMTLRHAGYGNDKNVGLNNNKVSLFYVNRGPMNRTPKHFAVTWDFNEFFANEEAGTFEWPSPHAYTLIKEEKDKESVIKYFNSAKFRAYGRHVEFNGQTLTIINRPVVFASKAGALRYYAGATDQEGNAYQLYWNIFNMFEPSQIEMTVDNSRYCKHCLQSWTSSADNTHCRHEWIDNLD